MTDIEKENESNIEEATMFNFTDELEDKSTAEGVEYGKFKVAPLVHHMIVKKPDDAPKRWSWETPPEPIPESEISETIEAEAIIVGGGFSGMAAAARATQLGVKVIVIEKMRTFVAHGGEIASIGSKIQRENGIEIDKEQFARDWIRISGSRCNEDLLWLFINRSEEAFEWVMDMGGDDVYADIYGGYYKGKDFTEYPVAQHIHQKPNHHRFRYSGALMICEMMQEEILKGGGQVIRGTQALRLEKENGRVVSVIAQNLEGKKIRYKGSRGIVLATGDISGDWEMLEAFSPEGLLPGKCASFPPKSNLGEGHKIGYWAGGAFEPAPWALSLHMTGYGCFMNFFLHVNSEGKRFMNEDTWSGGKSANILRQANPDYAFSVFDDKWYEEAAAGAPMHGGQASDPMNVYGEPWDCESNWYPRYIEQWREKGVAFKADTLEELAEQMGVPVDNFLATVKRYNELYRLGKDLDYGKRHELLTSIEKPPFRAVKIGPALLNVFGGFLTDTKLRVLDKNHKPVGGLLATGMCAGGLYGVDYPLLASGNSHGRCLTWALVIAETLAANEA